jgi:hypothetical protein
MLLTLTHDGDYALAQAMLLEDGSSEALVVPPRDAAAGAR